MGHRGGAVGGWPAAMDGYLTAMRAAGRAESTIGLHRHYLGLLAAEIRSPWSATPATLTRFMGREGWAAETRKSARAVVTGFYRWAHGMGYLDDNPALGLPAVRVPAGVPRPTPEHLVRRLVGLEDDRRLALMAMLAAYSGLRRAEIARVHADDLVGDLLLVRGKGGKLREVAIVHVEQLARLEAVEGWAFPNGRGSHLSPGHVGRLLSRAMPAGWSAHPLRHRAGTTAYAGTRDLLAVQQFLGHSRPETTQRYVRLPDDAVRAAARAAAQLAS